MGRSMRSGTGGVSPLAGVLLGSLMFLISPFGGAADALAAEAGSADCDIWRETVQNRISEEYFRPPFELGKKVQDGLATALADDKGYQNLTVADKKNVSDGTVGPVTLNWLKRFCVEFPIFGTAVKNPEAVMEAALHYAEIAKWHPDWKKTITSPDFQAWVQQASDDGQIGIRQIRRSGAAPVVTGLLKEFIESRSETTGTTSGPVDESCERLLETGLQTKAPRPGPESWTDINKIHLGLQAVFAGDPEFDGEWDQTNLLSDSLVDVKIMPKTRKMLARFCRDYPVAGSLEDLVRSLRHYAQIADAHPDWREIVTDPGFNRWLVQPLPKDEPGNRLLRLTGSAPIVNKLIEQYPRREPPSDECIESTTTGASVYYQLSDRDWQSLQEREAFVGQVKKLVGKKFDTDEELDKAIGPAADRLGNKCARETFLKTIQRWNPDPPTTEYRLTSESLDHLRDWLTSPRRTGGAGDIRFVANFISALEQLQDKGFASEHEFAQFIGFKAKLALAGEAAPPPPVASSDAQPASDIREDRVRIDTDTLVRQVVAAAERKAWSYEITDEAVYALQQNRVFVPFAESDLAELEALRGVAYVNAELYATAVREALAPRPSIEEEVQAIVNQARKMGDGRAPLKVKAAKDCGCSRRWDPVGRNRFTVYGFYPYWLSTPDAVKAEPGGSEDPSDQAGDESPEQDSGIPVDFGIFSRIGYFALELNEEGKIIEPPQWSEKPGAKKFIQVAHKYLTKVDVVIEARYWRSWDVEKIKQAVASIRDLLDPKPKESPIGRITDGVTIYFPGFRSAPEKHQMIVDFLTQLHGEIRPAGAKGQRENLVGYLRKQLMGVDNRLSLNILIGADRIDPEPDQGQSESIENLRFLGGLRDVLVADKQIVDLVLVLMGQPVSDLKKKLRLSVENEFKGEDRTNVLRRLVPVIPPNGHKWQDQQGGDAKWGTSNDPYQKLQHDLFYFRDNFRGVAFWPAVAATTGEQGLVQAGEVKERLISVFSQSEDSRERLQINSFLWWDPCVFVCPNAGYLMPVFFALLVGLILLVLLTYLRCGFRNLLVKYVAIGDLLILFGMFAAFITCVPTWQDRQNTILAVLLAIIIGSLLFIYIRRVKKGPLP